MNDELKHFIDTHRIEFDDKIPQERIWYTIEKKIFKKNYLQPVRYWQAAAIFFFAVCVYLWSANNQKFIQSPTANKEFTDTEAFYIQQISDKLKMIQAIKHTDHNGFTQDFQRLEAMYMVLKEEHNQSPSEKVTEAMILNLLVRINLLNQQLYALEKPLAAETNS